MRFCRAAYYIKGVFMDFTVCPSRKDDERELRALWSAVFGDGDDFLNPFFSMMYSSGGALTARVDGKLAASVYPLDVGRIVTKDVEYPCTMIYALGTLPEYRKQGLASALMRECGGITVLRPATEKLFDFYSALGYEPLFYCGDATFTSDMICSDGDVRAERIGFSDYGAMRERLLDGCLHIRYNDRALRFEEHLCSGGGMFALSGGVSGVCAVERYLNTAYVKELILRGGAVEDAMPAIKKAVPADKYRVRSLSDGGGTPFAMARGLHGAERGWYGFAFD